MSADEQAGIRQQLRANQDRLNAMKVVGTVNTREYAGLDTRKAREKLVAEMKKTGYKVDRHGFGEIRFEESEINNSLNYKEKDPSAEDARRTGFLVLQSVLKRGIEIEGHDMHKGRNYDTVTIAAPVEINGKRGNMAVVVKRTKGNRYKVHRILTTEGETFTMPEMANAEVNTVGAVTNNSQSLGGSAPAISSASENSIPDFSEKSNTDSSQKSQKSIEGTAEAVEEVRRLTRQNKRLEKLNRELKDQLRVAQASGAVTDRAAPYSPLAIRRVLGYNRSWQGMTAFGSFPRAERACLRGRREDCPFCHVRGRCGPCGSGAAARQNEEREGGTAMAEEVRLTQMTKAAG
ncbi:MAG: hypothetical protein ACI3WR_03340 [Oscillospiraceae bacterium]